LQCRNVLFECYPKNIKTKALKDFNSDLSPMATNNTPTKKKSISDKVENALRITMPGDTYSHMA